MRNLEYRMFGCGVNLDELVGEVGYHVPTLMMTYCVKHRIDHICT